MPTKIFSGTSYRPETTLFLNFSPRLWILILGGESWLFFPAWLNQHIRALQALPRWYLMSCQAPPFLPTAPPTHTQCWPASVPGRPQLWAAAMAFLHFLLLLASQLSRSMSTSGKNANTLLLASSVLLLPFFLTILCPMASAFFSLLLAVSCCPHSRKCIPWPFQQWQLPWLPKACGPSATLP